MPRLRFESLEGRDQPSGCNCTDNPALIAPQTDPLGASALFAGLTPGQVDSNSVSPFVATQQAREADGLVNGLVPAPLRINPSPTVATGSTLSPAVVAVNSGSDADDATFISLDPVASPTDF